MVASHRCGGSACWCPTYNEREALPALLGALRAEVPFVHVRVIDDASPDGTGIVADRVASGDPLVHVLHRAAKQGLGRAYLAGSAWARAQGYDAVVEMDADGSHQPTQLMALLAAAAHADVVIGSRGASSPQLSSMPEPRRDSRAHGRSGGQSEHQDQGTDDDEPTMQPAHRRPPQRHSQRPTVISAETQGPAPQPLALVGAGWRPRHHRRPGPLPVSPPGVSPLPPPPV